MKNAHQSHHKRNANQNHNKIPTIFLLEKLPSRTETTTNIAIDEEGKGNPYTLLVVGGM
jgi:hypothetical protein